MPASAVGPCSHSAFPVSTALGFFLLACFTPASAQNVLVNPGFEQGTTGWFGFGPVTFTAPTTLPRSGSLSAYIQNRGETWQGVAQSLLGRISTGATCEVSAWVRLDNHPSQPVQLTLKQQDGAGVSYIFIDRRSATNTAWTRLSGYFTHSVTGSLTELTFYVEGPDPGVSFYVDDAAVNVQAADWRSEANQRIEQLRKRDLSILVVDQYGRPLPQAAIGVRQTRHRFAFGSAITQTALNIPQYTAFFREHFEWAVPENEAKWYANEPSQGQLNYAPMDAIASFCQAHGITLRGHTIFWAVDEMVQQWVKDLSNTQLQAAMQARLSSVVTRYKDVFRHWDVNNEMLHGSFYADRLGPGINAWMFQQAQGLDPDCLLFVNDYNVVAGNETESYKAQILQLIADGAPVGGIGAQCHFSPESINPYAIKSRLDSLGELGLPIWCTEYDCATPDENVRADSLETLYRVAFSHSAVEGILMWGFWADRHWRGADAAIVNSDWTLNEAGRRYESLLSEWTTSQTGQTGSDGRLALRGFHGRYDLTAQPLHGRATSAQISLDPGVGVQEVVLQAQLVTYDFDGDRDTDLSDFGHLQACFTGGGQPIAGGCEDADLDDDGLIGSQDTARFLGCLSGPGIEADPACSGPM